jgi:hypothetical protein
MTGPPDGVAADLQCSVTQFTPAENGKERTISGQATMPCTVYCSYNDGAVGVSIRGLDLQIDLSVEELMALMQAGAEANKELTAPVTEKYTDEDVSKKWCELQAVEFAEAESPSGLVLAEPWWIFPRGVDRDDLWAWFDKNHSYGLDHLKKLTEDD